MRRLAIVCTLVSLVVAATAPGADLRYKLSGDWMTVNPTNGPGNGWLNTSVPGSNDTARANWGGFFGNTITLSNVAPVVSRFQFGVNEGGGVVVEDGGVLTSLGDSKVGNNDLCEGRLTINEGGVVNAGGSWMMVAGSDLVTGKLTVNGGAMNINGHLWVATGADSQGFVEINGGTMSVGGIIGVGSADWNFKGGIGFVNVNSGGVLELSNIHSGATTNSSGAWVHPSVMPGSVININGSGLITLPNDFIGVVEDYVDEGKITAYDGRGTVATELAVDGGVTSTWVTAVWGGITDIDVTSSDVVLQWDAWRFSDYTVEHTEDLTAPMSWMAIPGMTNIPGVEGTLSATTSVTAADNVAYRVKWLPGGIETIYETDFEDGAVGWTAGVDGGVDTMWELGSPTNVGPCCANSGTNCWGTNLATNYGDNADIWLRSPEIDATEYPSATLEFYDNRNMFYDADPAIGADGRVFILTNGVQAAEVFLGSRSTPWTLQSEPLPSELLGDGPIVLEFRFRSDEIGSADNNHGWLVDDVAVKYIP